MPFEPVRDKLIDLYGAAADENGGDHPMEHMGQEANKAQPEQYGQVTLFDGHRLFASKLDNPLPPCVDKERQCHPGQGQACSSCGGGPACCSMARRDQSPGEALNIE